MELSAFLAIFFAEYEAVFDEPFDGDESTLEEAFGIVDGDFDADALESAFVEAGVDDADAWGVRFWAQLSSALEEADV